MDREKERVRIRKREEKRGYRSVIEREREAQQNTIIHRERYRQTD